jgi:CRISPR-associated protein Csx10
MSTRWLKLQPEEPLLLGRVKADTNFLSSLPYIPGRIIRGAWADWLITQGRTGQIVSTVQPVQAGNFFPTMEWQSMRYVSPFLLSMLTCKR